MDKQTSKVVGNALHLLKEMEKLVLKLKKENVTLKKENETLKGVGKRSDPVVEDSMVALKALGWNKDQAWELVGGCYKEGMTTEELVKLCLNGLVDSCIKGSSV